MKKTKYIMSGGLAFAEEKDMERLRRFSLEGWHVNDFKFMGYTLEKGESSDYIYSIDYRSLKEDEKEEYFDFFSTAGWTHVASEGNIHLFRSYPGTKPIYSDRDTTVEKYENVNRSMRVLAMPLAVLTVLVWLGTVISTGTLKSVLQVVAVILTIIAIPATWTVIATYSNKWKSKGKKGAANVLNMVPFLLFILAVMVVAFVDGSRSALHLLAYMVIGAVAFPTAIWVVMSLYHKVKGKRA
ncbi:DUF2812 domain-containing protein [Alkalihalobacillus oceani]|uniref:DUF2812 domain-containing protein n=1 Tax=Halalkalibacter oceani TaxID=1653776 RepID=UPI00203B2ABE|nr:DUF2812 domain-containing protein [Halalkalibacter oceani]MCM3762889.1 DUF2812 domain-containing protein [Halalkalibacter oceani]